jgi:hypothetical protein
MAALCPDRAALAGLVTRARADEAEHQERYVTPAPPPEPEPLPRRVPVARPPLAELWHEPDGELDQAFDTFARASEEGQDTQTIVSLAADIVAARPGRRVRRAIARWIGGT